jgi:hypothetical protein
MRGLKVLTVWIAVLGLAGCAARPGPSGRAQAAPVCLQSYLIDHTTVTDDSTILFTMRDRSVWKNTLTAPCFGLRLDPRGFTYEATDPGSDSICSNLVTIRTNTDGNLCLLGPFVKISLTAHS